MTKSNQTSIQLHTSTNNLISLTSNKLESWFAHLHTAKHSHKHDSQHGAQLLGQFGMQNAQAVIAFLKSPVGKSVVALMEKQLADQIALENKVRIQQQASARKHLRRLMYLLLGLMYEDDANAKQLSETALHEIEKKRKLIPTTHKIEPEPSVEDLQTEFESYKETESALAHALNDKFKESAELEATLTQLAKEHEELHQRYSIYEAVVNSLDFSQLSQKPHAVSELKKTINQQISSYATIITALNQEQRFDEVRNAINHSTALELKATLLSHFQSIHQQNHHLFNRNGQSVESFDEADYIVPKDKTLALEGKQYFLFPISLKFSQLSDAQKAEAIAEYVREEDNIMSVKLQLNRKRTLEMSRHAERNQAAILRSEQMQREIHLLTTQLNKVQTACMRCELKLQQAQQNHQKNRLIHQAPRSTPRSELPLPTRPQVTRSNDRQPSLGLNYLRESCNHLDWLMKHTPSNASALARQRLWELRNLMSSPLPNPQTIINNTNTTAPITPFHMKPKGR